MNREDYLNRLQKKLEAYDYPNVDAVLSEYNRFYLMSEKNGETAEQILKKLGDPETVAHSYIMDLDKKDEDRYATHEDEYYVQSEYSTTKTTFLVVLNGLLVIMPYIAIWFVIGALYLTAAAVGISGGASFVATGVLNLTFYENLTFVGLGLSLVSLSGILFILFNKMSRSFVRLTRKYVHLNKRIARR